MKKTDIRIDLEFEEILINGSAPEQGRVHSYREMAEILGPPDSEPTGMWDYRKDENTYSWRTLGIVITCAGASESARVTFIGLTLCESECGMKPYEGSVNVYGANIFPRGSGYSVELDSYMLEDLLNAKKERWVSAKSGHGVKRDWIYGTSISQDRKNWEADCSVFKRPVRHYIRAPEFGRTYSFYFYEHEWQISSRRQHGQINFFWQEWKIWQRPRNFIQITFDREPPAPVLSKPELSEWRIFQNNVEKGFAMALGVASLFVLMIIIGIMLFGDELKSILNGL